MCVSRNAISNKVARKALTGKLAFKSRHEGVERLKREEYSIEKINEVKIIH